MLMSVSTTSMSGCRTSSSSPALPVQSEEELVATLLELSAKLLLEEQLHVGLVVEEQDANRATHLRAEDGRELSDELSSSLVASLALDGEGSGEKASTPIVERGDDRRRRRKRARGGGCDEPGECRPEDGAPVKSS